VWRRVAIHTKETHASEKTLKDKSIAITQKDAGKIGGKR
jgi:hypothetical protein